MGGGGQGLGIAVSGEEGLDIYRILRLGDVGGVIVKVIRLPP